MEHTTPYLNLPDTKGIYTYAEYQKVDWDIRFELIHGKASIIPVNPGLVHQRISGNLHLTMGRHFKNGLYQLFFAPFDVRLPENPVDIADEQIYSVVQPDLCVCNRFKLDERGCIGAPELIIEILSLGNSIIELSTKFTLYEECGVREYWLVEPAENAVFVYVLNEEGKYIGRQPAISIDLCHFP
jgi:Uma2 family endonuclease